jgi:inosose dehydratase
MTIEVGCGQITWRDSGGTEGDTLADIRDAGYAGAPWRAPEGATGDAAAVAASVRSVFDRYELKPAPGYLWADFWERQQRDEILTKVRRHAAVARELGLTEAFVAAGGFDRVMSSGRTRRQAAAHVTAADGLSGDEVKWFAEGLNAAAAATLEEGVRTCYHNHVGTVVETEGEIEQLLSLADPEVVFLGPDTGHLAWAGIDVVAFCARHAERILTLHLKDIVAEVRERGKAAEWDYATFSANGVFTELGEGCVDFAGMLRVLAGRHFDGWLIIETDVTQKPTALESAQVSRENLRTLGV